MHFLLTNDDGIGAAGLKLFGTELAAFGDVTIVAPDSERSGTGHSITVYSPLRIEEVESTPTAQGSYAVNGTPVDCVKIAVQGLGLKPDIVVSGVNLGANLGTDVLYSGTVGAALEALLLGYPALAVSQCGGAGSLAAAAACLKRDLPVLLDLLSQPMLLNVNVPDCDPACLGGMRPTRMGQRIYDNVFEQRKDPKGRPYYWMGGEPLSPQFSADEDQLAVRKDCVSVTPIQFDMTDYKVLEVMRGRLKHGLELD